MWSVPVRWCGATALLLVGACLGGCPADPRSLAETAGTASLPLEVAIIGAIPLTRPLFVAELSRTGVARVSDEAARRELAREVLDRMVQQELLSQASVAAGVVVSDADLEREYERITAGYPPGMFQRVLHAEQLTMAEYQRRLRRRLAVEAYLSERFSTLEEPSEAELTARFEANHRGEARGLRVRARQILLKTEEAALDLLPQLRKGALPFAEAARRHSIAPEAQEGGALGWFERGSMPAVFEVCFDLDLGKPSHVVASEFGFHIFLVEERREASSVSMDEERPRLLAELRQARQEENVRAHTEELRRKIQVTLSEEAFAAALRQLPRGPSGAERGPDEASSPLGLERRPDSASQKPRAPRAQPMPRTQGVSP